MPARGTLANTVQIKKFWFLCWFSCEMQEVLMPVFSGWCYCAEQEYPCRGKARRRWGVSGKTIRHSVFCHVPVQVYMPVYVCLWTFLPKFRSYKEALSKGWTILAWKESTLLMDCYEESLILKGTFPWSIFQNTSIHLSGELIWLM